MEEPIRRTQWKWRAGVAEDDAETETPAGWGRPRGEPGRPPSVGARGAWDDADTEEAEPGRAGAQRGRSASRRNSQRTTFSVPTAARGTAPTGGVAGRRGGGAAEPHLPTPTSARAGLLPAGLTSSRAGELLPPLGSDYAPGTAPPSPRAAGQQLRATRTLRPPASENIPKLPLPDAIQTSLRLSARPLPSDTIRALHAAASGHRRPFGPLGASADELTKEKISDDETRAGLGGLHEREEGGSRGGRGVEDRASGASGRPEMARADGAASRARASSAGTDATTAPAGASARVVASTRASSARDPPPREAAARSSALGLPQPTSGAIVVYAAPPKPSFLARLFGCFSGGAAAGDAPPRVLPPRGPRQDQFIATWGRRGHEGGGDDAAEPMGSRQPPPPREAQPRPAPHGPLDRHARDRGGAAPARLGGWADAPRGAVAFAPGVHPTAADADARPATLAGPDARSLPVASSLDGLAAGRDPARSSLPAPLALGALAAGAASLAEGAPRPCAEPVPVGPQAAQAPKVSSGPPRSSSPRPDPRPVAVSGCVQGWPVVSPFGMLAQRCETPIELALPAIAHRPAAAHLVPVVSRGEALGYREGTGEPSAPRTGGGNARSLTPNRRERREDSPREDRSSGRLGRKEPVGPGGPARRETLAWDASEQRASLELAWEAVEAASSPPQDPRFKHAHRASPSAPPPTRLTRAAPARSQTREVAGKGRPAAAKSRSTRPRSTAQRLSLASRPPWGAGAGLRSGRLKAARAAPAGTAKTPGKARRLAAAAASPDPGRCVASPVRTGSPRRRPTPPTRLFRSPSRPTSPTRRPRSPSRPASPARRGRSPARRPRSPARLAPRARPFPPQEGTRSPDSYPPRPTLAARVGGATLGGLLLPSFSPLPAPQAAVAPNAVFRPGDVDEPEETPDLPRRRPAGAGANRRPFDALDGVTVPTREAAAAVTFERFHATATAAVVTWPEPEGDERDPARAAVAARGGEAGTRAARRDASDGPIGAGEDPATSLPAQWTRAVFLEVLRLLAEGEVVPPALLRAAKRTSPEILPPGWLARAEGDADPDAPTGEVRDVPPGVAARRTTGGAAGGAAAEPSRAAGALRPSPAASRPPRAPAKLAPAPADPSGWQAHDVRPPSPELAHWAAPAPVPRRRLRAAAPVPAPERARVERLRAAGVAGSAV